MQRVFRYRNTDLDKILYLILKFMISSSSENLCFYSRQFTKAGFFEELKNQHYNDMIHIVTIRLSRKMDEDRGHELHRFLGAIFAYELSFSEKEKILVKEFGIKIEGDRKERLANMCNLGEGIWEQGMEQGKISGIIETCMKLNMSENDIIEKIKEIMHISGEEAKRYYKQAM